MRFNDDDVNLAAILNVLEQRAGIMNELVAAVHGVVPLESFVPACATCPAAFWYLDDELTCFCKIKKDDTWGRRATPIKACAEREMLLTPPEPGDSAT